MTSTDQPSLTEVFDAMDAQKRTAAAELRRDAAELWILETFDEIRHAKGHDYGNGQRNAELSRRRREHSSRRIGANVLSVPLADRVIRADELDAALRRIAKPRLARVDGEGYRRDTPATFRTRSAWVETIVRINRKITALRDA